MTKFFPRDILAKKFSGEFMEKKYFYFQPQYVDKFKCDGSKCDAHCCQGWNIFIDAKTFEQYSQLDSREIVQHMEFYPDREEYLITLNDKRQCPFLNENKLCRLQLKFGEKFLSKTCATYPRVTNNFGYFFERSLILSCPVAAEMILFEREPMKFEFVHVPEKIHSLSGKIAMQAIQATDELKEHVIEIQVAMISILQERTLTLDGRLIVLGFFLDKLEEIFSDFDADSLTKLIAAYESKTFLAEQVPLMIQSLNFDAEKFIRLILAVLDKVYDGENRFETARDKKFMGAVVDVFKFNSDEKNIVANFKALAEARKNFLTTCAAFLENFLVNGLFINILPWKFEGSLAQNFATFVTGYKIFELATFSVWFKGMDSKENLIELAGWFVTRFDHTSEYKQRIFEYFTDKDEPFALMESLLEGRD
ncbi:MAG: flagellin lysine-N-methylase [Selenomonadaceae bacterium]|nr:flagellin lysine-N-methylase [Selenomonadaceae bacterium]